jgi:hypothetical protein
MRLMKDCCCKVAVRWLRVAGVELMHGCVAVWLCGMREAALGRWLAVGCWLLNAECC